MILRTTHWSARTYTLSDTMDLNIFPYANNVALLFVSSRHDHGNSSSYFLEDFLSDTLSDEIFTYQESNGFCATPGCPNGDSDFVQGWGNNEAQYYTSCREGYSKNCDVNKNTTENAFIEDTKKDSVSELT